MPILRRGSESADFGLQGRAATIGLRGPDFGLEDCLVREAANLPGSGPLGLKLPEAQQGEPVRMTLSRRQFARAFAITLRAPTAHEPPVVQEELQQALGGTANRSGAPPI
jgi:hypothetical protein